jgi:SAM-dependent methyltransferase
MKKFEVNFPYFLEYPVKVVVKKIGLLGLAGWVLQKFGKKLIKKENIAITERIVEIPAVYLWLGRFARAGDRILEIGHVNSSLSLELAALGYNVTAIDIRSYEFEHLNLKSIRGDFLKHNFAGQFDFVISVSTIEHLGYNKRYGGQEEGGCDLDALALEKISGLLKPAGKFILTVPYAENERTDTWFKTYTRRAIEGLLFKNFRVEERKYFYRTDNWWLPAEEKDDPAYPYDGVAMFLLSKKL